ncbi:MAG: hypothetical protein LUD48_06535, partial [Prevotella sp.]|nr:hypothetical protein [Prevotella sp.]
VKEYLISEKSKNEKYGCYLYEVVPNVSYSLGTIVDYPANFGLKRVRGGYKIQFDYRSRENGFDIKKLQISVKGKNGEDIVKNYYDGESVDFKLKSSEIKSDSIDITIKGWILMNDSIYSGVVMSPYDERFEKLNVNRKMALVDEYKIFGIFPLWTVFWWWCPNNLKAAVIIWDIILALIIVIVILWIGYVFLRKFTKYTPEDNSITLTHL